MTDRELAQRSDNVVWTGRSLFECNKTSGSSANINSFHSGMMYISRSENCFGTLKVDEFAVMDTNGASLSGSESSKEWPLHLEVYQGKPGTSAAIHTHSTYEVL